MAKSLVIHAGDLRHRVSFLAQKITVEHGITKERWETVCTCWAAISPLSGREYFEAAAVNREDTVRFVIRFQKDITADMLLRFQGADYNIESILNPEMRNVRLEIMARSVTPVGDQNQH